MPFVTEETWTHLPPREGDAEFLMVSPWPDAADVDSDAAGSRDAGRAAAVERLIELIGGIRNARHEAGIAPAQWLAATIATRDETFRDVARDLAPAIERLARLRPLDLAADTATLEPAGDGTLVVLAGEAEARIRADARLGEAERARLERELSGARAALDRAQERLGNRSFTERAPADVVSAARERAGELRQRVAALEDRIR
jgi:valyl-tRNA synthetase